MIAATGSIGSMRPMKNVSASRPNRVTTTEDRTRATERAPRIRRSLLRGGPVIDVEGVHVEPLDLVAHGNRAHRLEDIGHRAVLHHVVLDLRIERDALRGIGLHA